MNTLNAELLYWSVRLVVGSTCGTKIKDLGAGVTFILTLFIGLPNGVFRRTSRNDRRIDLHPESVTGLTSEKSSIYTEMVMARNMVESTSPVMIRTSDTDKHGTGERERTFYEQWTTDGQLPVEWRRRMSMDIKRQPVVLVVDDQAAIRFSLRAFLEDRAFTVLEAENGIAGLRIFSSQKVDLILLDLRMPEMSGLEMLSRLRNLDEEVPIIVISGVEDVGEVVEALRLGASDFIQKPISDMTIVFHAMDRCLERVKLVEKNRNYHEKLEAEVAQKTEELQEVNARLKSVAESAKKFMGCGHLEQSGTMILEEFARHLGAAGGSLYTVADNRMQLIHSIDSGHAAQTLVMPLQPGSVLARALSHDKPFVVDDIRNTGWLSSGWQGYSSESCIVFPFIDHDGEVFAIISLHNPEAGRFAPHDREIGTILASYVSEALQTAQALAKVKKNEELMLQSQKLEAVGTLAGGIAHDFNNILSAIVGYTDLSLYSQELSDPIDKNLQQIKKASERAKDLVRQILSFSRSEEVTVSPVDIGPIIKEALKLLRATIPASISIEQEIPDNIGMVRADPGRIHQVLMNLCTNAAHAMQEQGGVLKVQYGQFEADPDDEELGTLKESRCIRLTVSDTGKGIEPEVLNRIFEPYFSTKKKTEGTGLGLAMVHGIVHNCGGVITVSSEVGKGSEFNVYLPRVEETTSGRQLPVDYLMPEGRERILFVDDEETLAEMAGEMLKKLGYSVEILTSSVEACRQLGQQGASYDLIITDQTMPEISGLELAKRAIALHPGLPIILYTGYSAAISEDEARTIGIRRVMMKPLSMTLLSQAVRQVLDGCEFTASSM